MISVIVTVLKQTNRCIVLDVLYCCIGCFVYWKRQDKIEMDKKCFVVIFLKRRLDNFRQQIMTKSNLKYLTFILLLKDIIACDRNDVFYP